MKAVMIEKPGHAVVKEIPDPVPKADEVLLQPKAGGICGTDVHIFEGNFIGEYPVIPCHEFSAEVVQLGEEVEGLKIGDPVAVDPNIRCGTCFFCRNNKINLCENYNAVGVTRPGGFAERVCVPAKNVHRLESHNYSTMAFSEPISCVLYGQSRLHFPEGGRVIIWGAGAIGLLHMIIAKNSFSSDVTIVDIEPKRIAKARKLGASEAVVADDNHRKKLLSIHPDGWDIAIDATGSVEAVSQMFRHLRRGGSALLFGVYPKEQEFDLSPFEVFLNDWSIYGSFTYRNEFSEAVRILSSEKIDTDSLIDRRIQLDEVPDILTRLAQGEKLGKVQVVML